MQTREATFLSERADAKARSVPVTISSETPVRRDGYIEVLSHEPGSIDLSRTPLPLIASHDTSQLPVGRVEQLRVDSGALKGIAVFGTSARALEAFADVQAGVIRSLSVGYTLADDGKPLAQPPGARRFAWAPHEVSMVAVPADPRAGFYRNLQGTKMETIETRDNAEELSRSQRRALARDERSQVDEIREIYATGKHYAQFGGRELADQAVAEARGLHWLRDQLMTRMQTGASPASGVHPLYSGAIAGGNLGLTRREVEGYSLQRAMLAYGNRRPEQAGLEFEASRALADRIGGNSQQLLYVPSEVGSRSLAAGTATAGGYLVATEHLGSSFLELLRRKSVLAANGATMLPGLVGNVSIPRQTAAATGYWLAGEGSEITESSQTFGQLQLTPKCVAALTAFSVQLLKQSSPNVEQLITADLAQIIALAVDQAGINGSGSSGEPIGVLNTAGIGSVSGTSLGASGCIELQSDLAGAHALNPNCVYITTPAVAGLLMARSRFSNTDTPLWQDGLGEGRILGYKAVANSAMPAGTMLFGDLSQIVIAEWGGLALDIDPFYDTARMKLAVRASYFVDIGVRYAASFSVASSIT